MDTIQFGTSCFQSEQSEGKRITLDGEEQEKLATTTAEAEALAPNDQMIQELLEQETFNFQQLKLQDEENLDKKEETQQTVSTTICSRQPTAMIGMSTCPSSGDMPSLKVTKPNMNQEANDGKHEINIPALPPLMPSILFADRLLSSGSSSNAFEPIPYKDLIETNRTSNNPKSSTANLVNISSTYLNQRYSHTISRNQCRNFPLAQSQIFNSKHFKHIFLLFTKILMQYLHQKDKDMFHRAKSIIYECAQRNKLNDPQYLPLTKCLHDRLRATVDPDYWRKAKIYLKRYLDCQRKKNERKKENTKLS